MISNAAQATLQQDEHSTPAVKSRQRWTKEEGRRLDKRLVWLELMTIQIQ